MSDLKSIKNTFTNNIKHQFSDGEIKSIWNNWILSEIFQISLVDSILHVDFVISSKQMDLIFLLEKHLLENKPIQYFFGYTYFNNLKITLDEYVLIPRVETEELIGIIKSRFNFKKTANIIDIGTGSGCIALSLKKYLSNSIWAIDFSKKALNRAIINAKNNGLEVNFELLDILKQTKNDQLPCFDVIVSNPPYVLKSEVGKDSNIHYEPGSSIFVSEKDPLIFYKAICSFAKQKLNKNGVMFFEINPKFHTSLLKVFDNYGYHNIETCKDIFGKKRFIIVYS